MSSQICLKWNSFLNNIATSFESLWEEEGLVDVTLASDGQCLTAHKVILSASSPFFKKVFQANPCQHPVIILQDVRFCELEALLIFIYKGEVNIEQKNLPALLKAAETLQIRGLSGGDIFSKDSFKRLADLEQSIDVDIPVVKEETPKKKQKVCKQHNNSILEKALTPRISQSENTSESNESEQSGKDIDHGSADVLPDPVFHRLEMKIEPLEMTPEDLQTRSSIEKDPTERLDTGQMDGIQGSSKRAVTIIAEAQEKSSFRVSELIPEEKNPNWKTSKDGKDESCISDVQNRREGGGGGESGILKLELSSSKKLLTTETTTDSLSLEQVAGGSRPSGSDFSEETVKGGSVYLPFPCPFCDRAYTSWGFRRRHIKAVHTISPSLNCKWCPQVLPTHTAWKQHVIYAHNLSANDAHNGLLILEEAHMVLQIVRPTRLDTLVNIIKQSSQQNDHSQVDKD
ncbi:PREDICTED: transcription factor GAGA-like isoform X1 [Polistes canadensis]|uniref:transcription factor GAGA-like isoform X1 n=1 Tax=Polistes canadensis TaxID=91411 RepID=UPI000719065F|nr:PREDICTED: transcription factor GAGA-like isoform X1 [Polistes canadensis]